MIIRRACAEVFEPAMLRFVSEISCWELLYARRDEGLLDELLFVHATVYMSLHHIFRLSSAVQKPGTYDLSCEPERKVRAEPNPAINNLPHKPSKPNLILLPWQQQAQRPAMDYPTQPGIDRYYVHDRKRASIDLVIVVKVLVFRQISEWFPERHIPNDI